MNIKNICFFNHMMNGDSFVSKEYVRELISLFPSIRCTYAHGNHQSIVADLNCDLIRNFPTDLQRSLPLAYQQESGTLFINTWVGCWIGRFLHTGVQDHANFPILYESWKEVYSFLNLQIQKDYTHYLPTINWETFDLSQANKYLNSIEGKSLILVCNGMQQSNQSNVGNMRDVVNHLAVVYPSFEFLLCAPIDVDLPNVLFADNIFNSNVGNLNQISYISQHAKLIIGKNSGPFTFSHTKENLENSGTTFLCFSTKFHECLMGAGNYDAKFYFSNTTDTQEVINICKSIIDKIY